MLPSVRTVFFEFEFEFEFKTPILLVFELSKNVSVSSKLKKIIEIDYSPFPIEVFYRPHSLFPK